MRNNKYLLPVIILIFILLFQSLAMSITLSPFNSKIDTEDPIILKQKQSASDGSTNIDNNQKNITGTSEFIDVNRYILGPGDIFSVYVTGKSNLSYQVVVYPDGNIYIPAVGPVLAKGRTINQLKYILQREFLQYYLPPLYLNLVVNNLKSIKVNVIGQVKSPGMYEMIDGSNTTKKLINFIRSAGGFNEYADYDQIEVVRNENNREKKYILNYTDINSGNLTQNILIKNGDTIFIPKRINYIYVLGQVNAPGAYTYTSKATVLYYIAQAGGLAKDAKNYVNIIRRTEDKPKVIKTNVKRLLSKGEYVDLEYIEPKDIIYVGKGISFGRAWNGWVNLMNAITYSIIVPKQLKDALKK